MNRRVTPPERITSPTWGPPHFHVNMPLVWSRPNMLCTDIVKETMSQGYY